MKATVIKLHVSLIALMKFFGSAQAESFWFWFEYLRDLYFLFFGKI